MSDDLPKYKLRKRAPEAPQEEVKPVNPDPPSKQPLGLKAKSEKRSDEEVMTSTDEILEDAYGASTRRRRRRERMAAFGKLVLSLLFAAAAIAATFIYAHKYESWPVLQSVNWYLPFALSAAFSAWICLQSLHFWRHQNRWLAIFGIFLAGLLCHGNLYLFEQASHSPATRSMRALFSPLELKELYVTAEFNALRSIPATRQSYTGFSDKEYKEAFRSISRDQWRPIFQQFLSADEMRRVTSLNINDTLDLVIQRLEARRVEAWDSLAETVESPPLEFKILEAFVAPYTWLISAF